MIVTTLKVMLLSVPTHLLLALFLLLLIVGALILFGFVAVSAHVAKKQPKPPNTTDPDDEDDL